MDELQKQFASDVQQYLDFHSKGMTENSPSVHQAIEFEEMGKVVNKDYYNLLTKGSTGINKYYLNFKLKDFDFMLYHSCSRVSQYDYNPTMARNVAKTIQNIQLSETFDSLFDYFKSKINRSTIENSTFKYYAIEYDNRINQFNFIAVLTVKDHALNDLDVEISAYEKQIPLEELERRIFSLALMQEEIQSLLKYEERLKNLKICPVVAAAVLHNEKQYSTDLIKDLKEGSERANMYFYKGIYSKPIILSPGIIWEDGKMKLHLEIPEMMKNAVIGKPLRLLVDHPFIPKNIVIKSIDMPRLSSGSGHITIKTSYENLCMYDVVKRLTS